MSHINTRIVKTLTSMAKISRVPVENQITTLSVVKITIKFSPCIVEGNFSEILVCDISPIAESLGLFRGSSVCRAD